MLPWQADQLLDITTGQLLCIICKQEVQEDMSGMPRHDTRLLLTKFNEQMEPLFNLLREVRSAGVCSHVELGDQFLRYWKEDCLDLQSAISCVILSFIFPVI